MGLFTTLSTVVGGGSALLQSFIEKKQDQKTEELRLKYQNERDIEIAKIQATSSERISFEVTKQNSLQAQISDNQTESARFNTIVEISAYLDKMEYKSVRIANFIIALTRPVITLILLLLIIGLSFSIKGQELYLLEVGFSTLDYTLAYWFVRRSYEKKKT